MDKTEFYNVLDISDPEEFTYYENMASLLEEDQTIEQNLIDDLLREVDFTRFRDLAKSYFEEFLNRVPDEETDLYFLADTMRRSVVGCEDPESLADAIYRFRKWYIVRGTISVRQRFWERNQNTIFTRPITMKSTAMMFPYRIW